MSVTKRTRIQNGKKYPVYKAEVYVRGIRLTSRSFDTQAAEYAWHDKEKSKLVDGGASTLPENQLTLKQCVVDYFARPDEIRNWIDWLHQTRRPVYAELATFMILTGCRVGEAAALHWNAVDLNSKLARIVRTVHWDHKTRRPELQESTKTEDSARIVLLPEFLVERLREMRDRATQSDIVFFGRDGG